MMDELQLVRVGQNRTERLAWSVSRYGTGQTEQKVWPVLFQIRYFNTVPDL